MFASKAVIVTGSASGIGRAAARRFAAEGGSVCVADIDGDAAERVAQTIRDFGGKAFASRVDVASEADNDRMVAETVKHYGGLDVVFLNAGYYGPGTSFFDENLDAFDHIIGINLRGCYLGMRSAIRVMRPGGAVVVTASTAGERGLGGNPVYSASKHGIIGLVRSAAEAFAAKGVRVNAICPGGVNTPLAGQLDVQDMNVSPDALPLPPFGGRAQPEHIAEFALYLASNRAAFITGGDHVIDGGSISYLRAN